MALTGLVEERRPRGVLEDGVLGELRQPLVLGLAADGVVRTLGRPPSGVVAVGGVPGDELGLDHPLTVTRFWNAF
jgi:hypothetical protein